MISFRPANERQPRPRIARQRTDRNISSLCAQFFARRIDVIDRQTDVLQAIIWELRRGGSRVVRVRRRYQHLLATHPHGDAHLAGIQRAGG